MYRPEPNVVRSNDKGGTKPEVKTRLMYVCKRLLPDYPSKKNSCPVTLVPITPWPPQWGTALKTSNYGTSRTETKSKAIPLRTTRYPGWLQSPMNPPLILHLRILTTVVAIVGTQKFIPHQQISLQWLGQVNMVIWSADDPWSQRQSSGEHPIHGHGMRRLADPAMILVVAT